MFHKQGAERVQRSQVHESPADGVLVHGLFIDGARWDVSAGGLVDSEPGTISAPLPVTHFRPSIERPAVGRGFACPLYKTSLRQGVLSTTGASTNFILHVHLSSSALSEDEWVLRGVALLCMLDD